jgi:hypothetical protein
MCFKKIKLIVKLTIAYILCFQILYAQEIITNDAEEPITNNIIADISQNHIQITPRFNGVDVLIFGMLKQPLTKNENLTITVEGPKQKINVKRKEKTFGFWLSGTNIEFKNIPTFYAFTSTNADSTLKQWQPQQYNFPKPKQDFWEGFLSLQEQENRYQYLQSPIEIIDNQLFRTTISLPSHTPIGIYKINLAIAKNKDIIAEKNSEFMIEKVGIEKQLDRAASHQPILNAIAMIAIAIFWGFCASYMFKKIF